MDFFRRFAFAAVCVSAWGVAASPARAHCGDDCNAPLPYALGPLGADLAADGVLGFPVGYGRAASALEFFSVRVVDEQGVEVAGTIEVDEAFDLLVWRPAQAWVPGASYTMASLIDTAGWAGALYGAPAGSCVTYEYEFAVTIDAEPLPAPSMPPFSLSSERATHEIRDRLDVLVCCDGAVPRLEVGPGSCPGYEVKTWMGRCARVADRGVLTVEYALESEMIAAPVLANLATRVTSTDGEPLLGRSVSMTEPRCLRYEVLDVARGQVFVEERCHGDELVEMLGDLERDPSAELAACAGPAYVCEGDEAWDLNACVTWPEGQAYVEPEPEPMGEATGGLGSDTGGCSVRGRGDGVWLVALMLAARRRRRFVTKSRGNTRS